MSDTWGSNDGTDNTSDNYATGVYGQAKSFDGSDDKVIVSPISSDIPTGSNSRTLCGWFKLNRSSTNLGLSQHPFNYGTTSDSSAFGFFVSSNSDEVRFYGHYNDIGTGINTQLNQWYFVAATYNGYKVRLYVNGEYVTSEAKSLNTSDTGEICFGAKMNDKNYWQGTVDDVRIYNTALTPQQVEKIYHKGAYRIPRRSTLQ